MPVPTDLAVPRVPDAAITVDGRGDEQVWAGSVALGAFTSFDPVPGNTPAAATTVRVLADDRALYLHFRADDPAPGTVRASWGRRDTRFSDDFVGMYLDTAGDAQRAWVFGANALGVQFDGIRNAGSDDEDLSWDGRWESVGRRTDAGYEVEIAIPWRTVRAPAGCRRLGIMVFRNQPRTGEKSSWPAIRVEVQGMLAQEAILGGPGELGRAQGLDLTPELTVARSDTGPAEDRWGVEGVSPGLTASWSPDPSLALLGTVNPDFSQVESDSARIGVNRRYALYYDEKRTFFLEGQEWFDSPMRNLVYTRTVVTPRYGLRATVDRGGWTAGVLHALDATTGASVSEGGGWTEEEIAGDPALVSIARLRRATGDESYLGALYSDRTLLDSTLANRVAGADARVRVGDTLALSGMALGSVTSYAEGDTRAAPAAFVGASWADRTRFLNLEGTFVAPEFRAENGFVTRADQVGFWAEGGVRHYTGGKLVPMIQPLPLDAYVYWNTAGELRDVVIEPDVMWRWGNGGFTFVEYQYRAESYSDTWFPHHRAEGGAGGSFTRWVDLFAFAGAGQGIYYDPADPRLGWQDWVAVEATLKPLPWLTLSADGAWERFLEADGTLVYDGVAGRVKAELFAGRWLWARAVLDRSTFEDRTTWEGLFAWERSPGRAIYLGGSWTDPSWVVFAKASWVVAL